MKSKLFILSLLFSSLVIAQPYTEFKWKDSVSAGVHHAVPLRPGGEVVINGTITDASKLSLSDSNTVWLPYWWDGKYTLKSDSGSGGYLPYWFGGKYVQWSDSAGTTGWYSRPYLDAWIASITGTGLISLNGLNGISQTFAIDTTVSSGAPAWSSATTIHTLRLPFARFPKWSDTTLTLTNQWKLGAKLDKTDTSLYVPYTYLNALKAYYQLSIPNLADTSKYLEMGDTTSNIVSKNYGTNQYEIKGTSVQKGDSTANTGYVTPTQYWANFPYYDAKRQGCVADSATNDSTKFKAILTLISAAGGGRLYMPPGVYYIGMQYPPSNTEIFGVRGRTIILPAVAGTFGTSSLRVLSTDTTYDNNTHDVSIHDLTFRDNVAFDEDCSQIGVRGGTRIYIENCEFIHHRGQSIYLSGYNASTHYHNRDVFINKCYWDGIDTSATNAISVIDCINLHITNNTFYRVCKWDFPGVIDIEPNQSFDRIGDIYIENNTFNKCGGNVGAISAFLTNGQDAAHPYKWKNFQIINNTIDSCTRTGYGIIFNGDETPTTSTESHGLIIKGNRITQATYGIAVSRIVDATISDNRIKNCGRSMSTVSYNIKWINNTFISHSSPSMLIGNSYRLVFDNNKFYSCTGTIFSFNTSGTFEDVTIKNTQVIDPGSVTTKGIAMTTPVTYAFRNLYENNNFNGQSVSEFPCVNRDWSNYASYDVFHRAGIYFANSPDGGTPGTVAITGDRIQAVPFIVSKTRSIDSLMYEVTTEGIGGGTMAIYNDSTVYSISSMPYPKTRLATGGRDTLTVGVKRIGFTAITLTPGIYWIVFTSNVNVTLRGNPSTSTPNMIGSTTYLGTTPQYTGYGDATYDYDEQAAVTPTTYPQDNTALYRYNILAVMRIATVP